ncbi:MAG: hypothetical protein OXJ56_00780, partial [Rhodospirillaceae bacterium]|nr:hypothetical protein [Rhodospirillaceae bacterium]
MGTGDREIPALAGAHPFGGARVFDLKARARVHGRSARPEVRPVGAVPVDRRGALAAVQPQHGLGLDPGTRLHVRRARHR